MSRFFSPPVRRILTMLLQAILILGSTLAILNLLASIQFETALDNLISVPGAAFIFLFGLFFPLPEPDPNEEDRKKIRQVSRRRVLVALVRLILMLIGGFGLVIGLLTALDDVQDINALLVIGAVYAVLILFIQRAERNRRIATLIFMAFCGFIVGRYADYRGYAVEEIWAIYGALALNYVFWLLIGRHFPPADSSQIEVWGMDE